MKSTRTGDEYLEWLHRYRQELWEDAQRRGLTTREFIEEINRRGREAWEARQAGRAPAPETRS
jgi:hypothetical protein